MKKKYYAIRTAMVFEKTVLVPVDSVEDIFDAIELVDQGVEVASIDLLNEQADCKTEIDKRYPDGILLSDDEIDVCGSDGVSVLKNCKTMASAKR